MLDCAGPAGLCWTVLAWEAKPGVPILKTAITLWVLARMEQVRSLSASTERVDADGVVAG